MAPETKPLRWARTGDLLTASIMGAERPGGARGVIFEITRNTGYDKLRGGTWVAWSLTINGKWEETFHRLKDAKIRASRVMSVTEVA